MAYQEGIDCVETNDPRMLEQVLSPSKSASASRLARAKKHKMRPGLPNDVIATSTVPALRAHMSPTPQWHRRHRSAYVHGTVLTSAVGRIPNPRDRRRSEFPLTCGGKHRLCKRVYRDSNRGDYVSSMGSVPHRFIGMVCWRAEGTPAIVTEIVLILLQCHISAW